MSHISQILKLAKPYHKWIAFLSVLVVIGAILSLFQTILIKYVVDEIQKQLTGGGGSLYVAFGIFFVMFILNFASTAFDSIGMRLGDYVSGRIGRYLTELFYEHIFSLPQKYFDSNLSGKILNQLSRGIFSLQDFLGALANFIFPALVQTVFSLVVLAYYNWIIALLAFLVFPIYIIVSYYSTNRWGMYQVKRNKFEDITRGRVAEVIQNMKLVKGYNMQKQEYDYVADSLDKSIVIYDKQSVEYHILNFIRNFGLEIALFFIGLITIYQTFTGIMTFGTLVLILQLLGQLRRPLFAMSFILERIKRAESGSKEFLEILNLEKAENFQSSISNTKNPQLRSESVTAKAGTTLQFKNVSFEYEKGGRPVLQNVSFELKSREITALVGESGAGKTTITNLIMKFYKPISGDITMNKKSYTRISHDDIRRQTALVFQDAELFSTTIRENVTYGSTEASEAEITDALKKARAWEFVRGFKKGIDTEIGERGIKLSGGQKQRVQIARAILRNAPILILDEATSSLDAKSEKLVHDALDELMKGKLVVIIAHRFSTIQNADRVLVIDKGKIVDSGVSSDLAQREGIYRELLRYQIEGNKKLLAKYELS